MNDEPIELVWRIYHASYNSAFKISMEIAAKKKVTLADAEDLERETCKAHTAAIELLNRVRGEQPPKKG